MMTRGIDVSKHNGNIDFNKVKAAGYDFVIIRAGYGKAISQKDRYFEQNYARAKAAGLNVGAYWYSYSVTEDDAKKEAEACLEVIKSKQFEMPIYYDIEENKALRIANKITKIFCGILERKGYFVGIYASASPLKTYFSEDIRKRYSIWVAHYGVSKPNYSGQHGIWQYSSTGIVPGISGNVDMNECYVNFPEIIKTNELNGFGKTHTVASDDTLSSIAKKYDIDVDTLAKKNHLIYEGQKLIV